MRVRHLNKTAQHPSCWCGPWLNHWLNVGKPSVAFALQGKCAVVACENPIEVGGLVQKDVLDGQVGSTGPGDQSWYVVPLCAACNLRTGEAFWVDRDCGLAWANAQKTCAFKVVPRHPELRAYANSPG